MNKILTLSIILITISFDIFSQQLPIFTQYRENLGYINPGALSSDYFVYEYNMSYGVSYRNQWSNFEYGPSLQTAHGEFLTDTQGAFEWITGGYIINDNTDPISMTGLYGRIGTVLLTEGEDIYEQGLSLGFNVGVVQYRMNLEDLLIRDPNDISATNQKKVFPDVGFGIFYYKNLGKRDHWYAGFSIPQLFGLDLTYENNSGDEFSIQRIQHYYGLLGLYKTTGEFSFLEISLWPKYVPNAPFHLDLNARYQFSDTFWIGAGASTTRSIHLEFGVILGENINLDESVFRIGFGYDPTFGSAATPNHFGTSQEINISYSRSTY